MDKGGFCWLGFYGVYSNAQRVKLFHAKFNYFLLSIQLAYVTSLFI